METRIKARSLFDPPIVRRALIDSFLKLDPRHQVKNPVMFVVEVGSVLTTFLFLQALLGYGEAPTGFILAISLWLWFTVVFANFAEAMAEGRGKAQADTLRRARRDIVAKKLTSPQYGAACTAVSAATLRQGDVIVVEAGDFIPSDGEVLEGIASVDESAITGESAPVIRESGGDRSAVTGGTRVLSDWLVIRIRKPSSSSSTWSWWHCTWSRISRGDNHMLSQLRPALVSLGLFTLLMGLLYPLAVTGLAQVTLSGAG